MDTAQVMALQHTMLTLQKICLVYIIFQLEEFSPELLSLLPLRIRQELLNYLPLADVFVLDSTNVSNGMDMNSFWTNYYQDIRKYTPPYYGSPTSYGPRDDVISLLACCIFSDNYVSSQFLFTTKDHSGCFNSIVPPRYFSFISSNKSTVEKAITLLSQKCKVFPKYFHFYYSRGSDLRKSIEHYPDDPNCLYHFFHHAAEVSVHCERMYSIFTSNFDGFDGYEDEFDELVYLESVAVPILLKQSSLQSVTLSGWSRGKSKLWAGICELFMQPQFKTLKLTNCNISVEDFINILSTFLRSSSSCQQCLDLTGVHLYIFSDRRAISVTTKQMLPHFSKFAFTMHDSAFQSKCLTVLKTYYVSMVIPVTDVWLPIVDKLRLKSLRVSEVGILKALRNHKDAAVENIAVEYLNLSDTEGLTTVLQLISLPKLKTLKVCCDVSKCGSASVLLPALRSALNQQASLGTLQELVIQNFMFRSVDIMKNHELLQKCVRALLSLPQISKMELNLPKPWFTERAIELIKNDVGVDVNVNSEGDATFGFHPQPRI